MPTLEITQELLDQLNSGESITIKPPKKKIELKLEQLSYYFTDNEISPGSFHFLYSGRNRKNRKACKLAQTRMNKMNRLSQLAHQLGGEKEFVEDEKNWYIYEFEGKWAAGSYAYSYFIEIVYMTEVCAKEICEILNNKEFEL